MGILVHLMLHDYHVARTSVFKNGASIDWVKPEEQREKCFLKCYLQKISM